MQAKLEPSPGNSVQMTLSDWGKSVTVTKPAA
jgi:lipoprotein LprG